jgi:hypothetical protein
MAEVTKKDAPPTDFRAGLGMDLTAPARQELRRSGFRIRPAVSIVHQQKTGKWMLAGEEGGGSVKAIGHYVGYVGTSMDKTLLSLPVQALLPNVIHRRVISASLIRFEIFRYEQSCELAITHLYLDYPEEGKRPRIARRDLFRGRDGLLTSDNPVPLFFSRSGELLDFAAHFTPGITAVTRGVQCMNCKHAHLIGLPPIQVNLAKTPARPGPPLAEPLTEAAATSSTQLPKLRTLPQAAVEIPATISFARKSA